jgi:hypothetical protein
METTKTHKYEPEPDAVRLVCKCGRPLVDAVHQPEIRKVQGTAKPTKTGGIQ